MLAASIEAASIDLAALQAGQADLTALFSQADGAAPQRWKDWWSAGHSTSGVSDVPTVADLVERTVTEYQSIPAHP